MLKKFNQGNITEKELRYRAFGDKAILRIFLLPSLILLLVLNIFPLFYSLFLSFTRYSVIKATNWGTNPILIGALNYTKILSSPIYWNRFATTGKYVVLSVAACMIIGFGLALLLQLKFKGREFFLSLFILPMTMCPIIVGIIWKLFYHPSFGVFNTLLGLGKLDWLSDPKINFYAILIADVWMWTPFVMLLSIAGLSAVPNYLYEAAEIDRASWWFKFRRITLPTVSPILMIAMIFRTIEAFKTFDIAMSITGRGATAPQLLAVQLYKITYESWFTSEGSALGYIMLALIVSITMIFVRYLYRVQRG
jgi:multiple sugar transport system permease protein